jgi:hypothetical protein
MEGRSVNKDKEYEIRKIWKSDLKGRKCAGKEQGFNG